MRRLSAALILTLALALLAGGCGLRPDDQPQAIARSSLPQALFETETGTTGVTGIDANIFLVSSQGESIRLVKVPVSVDGGLEPTQAAIQALLSYMPPPNSSEALTSPIAGTPLLGLKPDGKTLEVNMGSPKVEGAALRQALAQVVFTATEDPSEFDSVRFLQNGETFTVPLLDKTLERGTPVHRSDYSQLDPSRGPGTTTPSTVK